MAVIEKPSAARAISRAVVAVMVAVLIVGIASTPVKAAPRPRRRSEPLVVRPLRVVNRRVAASSRRARGEGPLEDRVAAFVAEQRAHFESAPGVAAAAPAARLALVREEHAAPDVLRYRRIAERFRPELACAGRDAPAMLDALVAAASWRSWDHLHRQLGRTPDRAARAMELLVRGILAGAHPVVDRS